MESYVYIDIANLISTTNIYIPLFVIVFYVILVLY